MFQRLGLHILITLLFGASMALAEDVYRRNVDIEWEPIDGAKTYDLELEKASVSPDDKPMSLKSPTPIWTGPLSPGIYKMRVRARDRRNVPGDWSASQEFTVGLEGTQLLSPTHQQKIDAQEPDKTKVDFTWAAVGGASSYSFQLINSLNNTKVEKEVTEPKISLKIPVSANYTWTVKARGFGLDGEASPLSAFVVMGPKINPPVIERPETPYVRELKWSHPERSAGFAYTLKRYNPKTKNWDSVASDLECKTDGLQFDPKWPGGKYKVAVKAKGVLRPSSEKAELEFPVHNGDRSPAAEEVASVRQSIDKLTGWYGIASYLITMMNFKGKNFDSNSVSAFEGVGGTGRLGAGYLSQLSPWGFLGVVDLSGIALDGYGNYTFASFEFNGIYRLPQGNLGEIRHQFGLYYKELPELIANNSNNTLKETHLLKYAGPHYGFEYWYALTSKLGLQVNTHLYPGLFTVKTPTSQKIVPSASYQLGVFGSYRLKKNMTGLLGYTFRHDQAQYKSADSGLNPGETNSATIEGNYLNLFLEWAL